MGHRPTVESRDRRRAAASNPTVAPSLDLHCGGRRSAIDFCRQDGSRTYSLDRQARAARIVVVCGKPGRERRRALAAVLCDRCYRGGLAGAKPIIPAARLLERLAGAISGDLAIGSDHPDIPAVLRPPIVSGPVFYLLPSGSDDPCC